MDSIYPIIARASTQCVDGIYCAWSSLDEQVHAIWERVKEFFVETYEYFFPALSFKVDIEGIEEIPGFSDFFKDRSRLPSAGGENGACFVLDQEGNKIGVFKPENLTPSFHKRFILFMKSLVGQDSCLSQDPLRETKAELTAQALSDYLGLSLTPTSSIKRIGDVVGVYQEFISDMKEAKKETRWLNKTEYEEQELTLFQKFTLFDVYVGNLDRHPENWFVRIENGVLKEIKAIDNANTFPVKNPVIYPFRNQYAWSSLNIAKQPFTKETKEWLERLFSEGKSVDDFVALLEKDPILKGFISQDMQVLLQQRFNLIQQAALDPDFCPQKFSNYRLDSHLSGNL